MQNFVSKVWPVQGNGIYNEIVNYIIKKIFNDTFKLEIK